MSNNKWKTENISNQSRKVAIKADANSGAGFEVAKEFARAGAHVIMGCRNLEKAEDSKTKILKEILETSS